MITNPAALTVRPEIAARLGGRTTPLSSGPESSSFAQQLAAALEGYLRESPSGAPLQIEIQSQNGQDSGTRQFLVTLRTPAPPPPQPTGASDPVVPPAPPALDVTGMMMYSGTVEYQPQPEEPAGSSTEQDAYWALQPPEVQVLRTIPDFREREQVAWQLARQGFSVDADIMVYHQDPYMTMKIREGEGYTWVPAWGQGGIPVAPGLSFPGLPSYNVLNPPPGSIRVSYEFAQGLEHTSPGWRPAGTAPAGDAFADPRVYNV